MGKKKRVRAQRTNETATQEGPALCGCNPDVVTEVIVVIGRNKAAVSRATDRLDKDPHVAIMAFSEVREEPLVLFKECAHKIAHLPKTLREMAEAATEDPKGEAARDE